MDFFGGVTDYRSPANIEQGLFGTFQHSQEIPGCLHGHSLLFNFVDSFPVSMKLQNAFAVIRAFPILHVFGNVNDHRAGPAAFGDLERCADRSRQLGRILDEKYMFGARTHQTVHRGFLKGIGTDDGTCHLAADEHYGHGIRHAVANRGGAVGGPRP
ncbi:MAG: hypothetical protein BWX80_00284 [Candidatus Hydrogenedentes bacterium ADurb.Bin101]|nr:MAG: hypothetical protein BWX80_00284 [Candidatus Hydrogenedentes bacterium ADurb.Bin101]